MFAVWKLVAKPLLQLLLLLLLLLPLALGGGAM